MRHREETIRVLDLETGYHSKRDNGNYPRYQRVAILRGADVSDWSERCRQVYIIENADSVSPSFERRGLY